MLIRMLPEQIAKLWHVIKPAIEASLPPIASDPEGRMNNVLSAMLVGGIDCWVSYRKLSEGIEVNAIVTTTIVVDNISGTRSLLIYSIYSPDGVELGQDGWAEGYDALSKYARAVNCSNLSAYSPLDYICEIAESLGGNADFRYITVPLK